MPECWRCGRAVPEATGVSYLFGVVCRRAECRRVESGLSDRFKSFWWRQHLPCPPDDPGRTSAWSRDGDFQGTRGYAEPSLQSKIDADRKAPGDA